MPLQESQALWFEAVFQNGGTIKPRYTGMCHAMVVHLMVDSGLVTDQDVQSTWQAFLQNHPEATYLARKSDYQLTGRQAGDAPRGVILTIYAVDDYEGVGRIGHPLHSVVTVGNGLVAGFNNQTATVNPQRHKYQIFSWDEITYGGHQPFVVRGASAATVALRLKGLA